MGTMHSPASVLQIPSFKCVLQRQCFYPASATTTASAAGGIATTTRIRAEPVSTAPDSIISVANFLVDLLEFSTQHALSSSIKLIKLRQSRGANRVCQSNFLRNADLVISFLQQKGFEKSQIRKLVTSTPRILACRVGKNLEPKMNYFQEVGFSVSDVVDISSKQPGILYYSLDSAIRPAVEALRAIMGSDEDAVRVIKGLKLNTLPLVTKHLVHNVSLLQAHGIPIESIRKRIRQHSPPFIRTRATFKDMMARAETKWGVSPHSTMFLYAIHVLGCLNEKNIESKCQVLQSFGWARSDVVDLFRRNPLCFGLSERKIKAALGFYMNELAYDPGFIIKFPVLLCYSLEKRVFPRHLVLQLLEDKGLIGEDLPFYRALRMNEPQFLNKFIRPFEDKVPNLRDIYVNRIASSAQHQIERRRTIVSQE